MKSLEKILNAIRIAPHGIIPATVATALAVDGAFNLGLYENLPSILQIVDVGIAQFCAGFGSVYYISGVNKYRKFKKVISEQGIDKRHVEPNLRWYCERQAYKAAAYSYDLGKEFDEINRNYTGEKGFTWIPEI